jgi:hypothetical protein
MFVFRDIPPGTYTLRAIFGGFEVLTKDHILINPGDAAAVELPLKPIADPVPNRDLLPRAAATDDKPMPNDLEPPALSGLIQRTETEVAQQQTQQATGEGRDVNIPLANRWGYRYPDFRRYPGAGDFQFAPRHWYDPFNTNRLKGDIPVFGNDAFLTLGAASETLNEVRQLPLAPNPSKDTSSLSRTQYAMLQNFSFSAELFGGDAAYRPATWRFRITPVLNANYTSVGSPSILNFDRSEYTRFSTEIAGLQEAFAEVKLKDLSDSYDFVSLRAGIQSFASDFRGFLFADSEPGIRLFGTLDSNRYQYSIAGFVTLVKDANSGLNTLIYRNQQVYVANLYRQDFPWRGYTMELSFHYDKDDPSFAVNSNNFQVRPVPIGPNVLHAVRAYYLGEAGDGHVGRVNVSQAFYEVVGHDTYNALALRPVRINAQMAALELSLDRDWVRYRTSFFYASGSRDPHDATARGFDSIVDNPNFAGGVFSYWNRESINITPNGIALMNPGSLVPDLRSGKASGQANFVNPGLLLFNTGIDVDLTPKLRAFANLNLMRFVHTQPLEVLLNRPQIHSGIGADSGIGVRYRPLLTDNIILVVGFNTLFPFAGFRQIYPGGPLYALFTSLRFQY